MPLDYRGHTRRSGKTWLQHRIAITESREGKEAWVMNNKTTDIYVDGELDRTVPTDNLFARTQRGDRCQCKCGCEGKVQFVSLIWEFCSACGNKFAVVNPAHGPRVELEQSK